MSQLSEQAYTILQLIAEGYTDEKLLSEYQREEIQDAAREALELASAERGAPVKVDKRVKTSLRTYEVWTDREDTLLMEMIQNGNPINEISAELERHPMTIRRRLIKLGFS